MGLNNPPVHLQMGRLSILLLERHGHVLKATLIYLWEKYFN
jgi:hypothetical protein